jgi:hypothetical protein
MKFRVLLPLSTLLAASLLWQGCGKGDPESNPGAGKPVFVSGIFQKSAAIQAHLDLQAANESAFAKTIREKFPEQQKQFENLPVDAQEVFTAIGVKPEDFSEFAFVLGSLDFVRDGVDELPEDVALAVAFKVNGEVDINKVLDLAAAEADEEGQAELQKVRDGKEDFEGAALYKIPVPDMGEGRHLFVAHKIYDDATYVLGGNESTVRNALSSGKPGKPSEGSGIQARLLKDKIGWLAVELPDGLLDQFKDGAAENPFLKGVANLLSQIQAVGLSGNVTDVFPLQVRIGFSGETPNESATQAAAAVNGILGFVRLGALKNPAAFPPFFNSLAVAAEGPDVVANVTFTIADVEFAQKKAEETLSPTPPPPLENE